MKLQTDPTVIYGLGDAFDGNLRKRDLLADTPYNTYTRHGLPPTPISLVGREAINAAVHPGRRRGTLFRCTGRWGTSILENVCRPRKSGSQVPAAPLIMKNPNVYYI